MRTLERRRNALGDGEWLPPDSESPLGAGIPSRGGPPVADELCIVVGMVAVGVSESRRLNSESLGAAFPL